MKDIKEIINSLLRNKMFIGVAVGIIVLVVAILIILLSGGKKQQSQILSESLKELGADFYETFYYEQIGGTAKEKKEFLDKYKDLGIKFSLDSLANHNKEKTDNIIAEFVNKEKGQECDRNNSMVVIYPKEPYGKTDYSIDAILDCGFEKTETK